MGEPDWPEETTPERRKMPRHLFFCLLFLLIVLIAGFVFVRSETFFVGGVAVTGTRYLTDQEVYRIAGVPEKVNIFRLNTAEIHQRLLRDLRVADADVSRRFPDTIVIRITERKPLAIVACSYGYVEVDKEGMVLAAHKTLRKMAVPLLTGVKLGDVYVGDRVGQGTVLVMLDYLSQLDEAALNQLSELHEAPSGYLTAYTNGAAQIRIGGGERLREKAALTDSILREIEAKHLAVEYADLTSKAPFIKFKSE